MPQRVAINPVTRIEGHAQILVDLDDQGQVLNGHLQVWELRGFEKLLEHTDLFKMPQVTARLCGVCPAAHHLAAVAAIEQGLGVTAPRDATLLRELLYVGHILHSHALSNFVLAGPDTIPGLDVPLARHDIFSLLKFSPDLARKALRLRSIGQRTVETVGGRGVHPVTAVPGGMTRRPTREEIELLAGWGREAVALVEELGDVARTWLDALEDLRAVSALPGHALALSRDGTVDFLQGDWVVQGPDGKEERRFASATYDQHLVEHAVPDSYMKSVHLRGSAEKAFYVGALARLNVNAHLSTPKADAALADFRAGRVRRSAVDFLYARLVEMLHCAERMAAIPGELGDGPLRVPAAPREGRYVGAIEAPRGLLVHDYHCDKEGRVDSVNFIVATQTNYDAIDQVLTSMARHLVPQGQDANLMNGLEFALRCFDPCLACATHAAGRMPLEVVLRAGGKVVRRVSRRFEP